MYCVMQSTLSHAIVLLLEFGYCSKLVPGDDAPNNHAVSVLHNYPINEGTVLSLWPYMLL